MVIWLRVRLALWYVEQGVNVDDAIRYASTCPERYLSW